MPAIYIKPCALEEDTKITTKLILINMYRIVYNIQQIDILNRWMKYLGSLEEEQLIFNLE